MEIFSQSSFIFRYLFPLNTSFLSSQICLFFFNVLYSNVKPPGSVFHLYGFYLISLIFALCFVIFPSVVFIGYLLGNSSVTNFSFDSFSEFWILNLSFQKVFFKGFNRISLNVLIIYFLNLHCHLPLPAILIHEILPNLGFLFIVFLSGCWRLIVTISHLLMVLYP